MHYPPDVVAWFADLIESGACQFTPLEVLRIDELYPALMEDISIEVWQRKLAKDQLGKKK